jgi:IclR family KDG regulon transcriptional repressor
MSSRNAAPDTHAPPVNALLRGIHILELLAGENAPWSTSDIARRLKLPKSTTSNLLHTLLDQGYVRRDGAGDYRLTMRLVELSGQALRSLGIREAAQPVLRRLVAETETTAHLAVLDGAEAVYIERVPSPGFIQVNTWVGRRMPMHSTSVGKALAAYLSDAALEELLVGHELQPFTPKTIVSPAKLRAELRKIREAGVSVDDEENTPGIRCVAAPIFAGMGAGGAESAGKPVAAVSLTGPAQLTRGEQLDFVIDRVKWAARHISQALGGRPRGAESVSKKGHS